MKNIRFCCPLITFFLVAIATAQPVPTIVVSKSLLVESERKKFSSFNSELIAFEQLFPNLFVTRANFDFPVVIIDNNDCFGIQGMRSSNNILNLILTSKSNEMVFKMSDISADLAKDVQNIIGKHDPEMAAAFEATTNGEFELIGFQDVSIVLNNVLVNFDLASTDKLGKPEPTIARPSNNSQAERTNGWTNPTFLHESPFIFTFLNFPASFRRSPDILSQATNLLSAEFNQASQVRKDTLAKIEQHLLKEGMLSSHLPVKGSNFADLEESARKHIAEQVLRNFKEYGFKDENEAMVALESARISRARTRIALQYCTGTNSYVDVKNIGD